MGLKKLELEQRPSGGWTRGRSGESRQAGMEMIISRRHSRWMLCDISKFCCGADGRGSPVVVPTVLFNVKL
jgi:hypothetical protein